MLTDRDKMRIQCHKCSSVMAGMTVIMTMMINRIITTIRCYPSAEMSAFVPREKASLPAPGSDKQNDPIVSVASIGKYFCLISSLP